MDLSFMHSTTIYCAILLLWGYSKRLPSNNGQVHFPMLLGSGLLLPALFVAEVHDAAGGSYIAFQRQIGYQAMASGVHPIAIESCYLFSLVFRSQLAVAILLALAVAYYALVAHRARSLRQWDSIFAILLLLAALFLHGEICAAAHLLE
jgi:hypothetical protein